MKIKSLVDIKELILQSENEQVEFNYWAKPHSYPTATPQLPHSFKKVLAAIGNNTFSTKAPQTEIPSNGIRQGFTKKNN